MHRLKFTNQNYTVVTQLPCRSRKAQPPLSYSYTQKESTPQCTSRLYFNRVQNPYFTTSARPLPHPNEPHCHELFLGRLLLAHRLSYPCCAEARAPPRWCNSVHLKAVPVLPVAATLSRPTRSSPRGPSLRRGRQYPCDKHVLGRQFHQSSSEQSRQT